METKRLRIIQQPSRLERLLEAYVTRSNVVPPDSYQIRDPDAVVPLLRSIALQAAAEGRVWACWGHGAQLWLFTAEMSLPLSRERGRPVLWVNRYNDRGELIEAGSWVLDPGGFWRSSSE
jgi:hypothetical protein